MVFAKTFLYNPTDDSLNFVANYALTGNIIIATRPNAQNPAYMLFVSDTGELRVYNKDGSTKWTTDSGVANINSAHINNNAEVVIQTGSTVKMYSSTGSLVWTQTVTSAHWAQIGTSHVAVSINTGVAGTSGISWRSLVDGSQTQAVHGVASTPNNSWTSPCSCNEAGDIVYLIYVRSTGIIVGVERFTKTGGRTNATTYTPDGAGSSGPNTIHIHCNYDGSVVAVSSNLPNSNVNNINCRVFDGSLTTLGSVTGALGIVTFYCRVNPVGSRVALWLAGGTTVRFITVSPFSVLSVTASANMGANRYSGDVSDEAVFVLGTQDGAVRFYEDSTTVTQTKSGSGVANQMVCIIRNV